MPRARVEEWSALPAPRTPLQRAAYLDACVRWLAEEPPREAPGGGAPEADDGGGALSPRSALLPGLRRADGGGAGAAARAGGGAGGGGAVACTTSDLGVRASWRCAACGDDGAGGDVRPVAANPYAQQHIVLVCRACAAPPADDDAP